VNWPVIRAVVRKSLVVVGVYLLPSLPTAASVFSDQPRKGVGHYVAAYG